MRRLTLLMLALAWPAVALGQSPQSAPRDLPAPPVFYSPAPAPPPVIVQQPAPRYYQAPAQAETLVRVPLVPGRAPRSPRGPLVLSMRMPKLCCYREPALEAVQTVQQAVYQVPEDRGLVAPPKAPSPRALPAAQAPGKDPGGIEEAEGEPDWAIRLGKRLGAIERRLDEIHAVDVGDRAPAPPVAPGK